MRAVDIDSTHSIVVLGDQLPYADGSEAQILEILEHASDRSSTSDELAARIVDWPTRYHLSRLRRNLFAPLRIEPGMRILEIGCGTGANLKVLAEAGAEVVGVEGTMTRARCARVRTLEHDNVTVYAGDVADLPATEPFDLVVLVGVLEYAGAGEGGARGPKALLERARGLLKPDGVLMLAIENQLGLKYLLGHPEDHLGLPWIGIEGYPDRGRPRTWSRAVLGSMLDDAGFTEQEWLYPFPDYKLPTFIARDRLFRSVDGRQTLRQFLRDPVGRHSSPLVCAGDAAHAYGVMLDALIGPDTANSFLVVASCADGAATRAVGAAEAWFSSAERLQRFRSDREIVCVEGGFEIHATSPTGDGAVSEAGWLSNQGHRTQRVHLGDPLDSLLLAALANDDIDELTRWLEAYDRFLSLARTAPVAEVAHPYFVSAERPNLPGEYLDCSFKNLVVDAHGEMHFIDREWTVAGTVDEELVRLRSYFELAHEVAHSGTPTRWSRLSTVGDLCRSIRQLVSSGWATEDVDRYIAAENDLQRLVTGRPLPADPVIRDAWCHRLIDYAPRLTSLALIRQAQESEPLRAHADGLSAEVGRLAEQIALLAEDRERVAADRDRVAADRDRVVAASERTHQEADRASTALAHAERENDALREALVRCQTERDAFDDARSHLAHEVDTVRQSRAFRLGRALTAPSRWFRTR